MFWYAKRYHFECSSDTVPSVMDYLHREVFPSSPLALVAAEVRFNDSARLRQQETIDAISIALEPMLPVQDQYQQAGFEVRPDGPPQLKQSQGRTFKNISSTAVATLTSDRLSLETTTYSHFSEFREQLLTCCRAVAEAGVTPALRRIGLRYIDEIRTSDVEVTDPRQWTKWIDSRLVNQMELGPDESEVLQSEGVVTYRLPGNRGLNLRFAALARGAVVSPAELVRKPFDAERSFFVLDLDGYQDFVGADATLFSVDVIATTLDALHGPTGVTFQASITDEAREIFRRS